MKLRDWVDLACTAQLGLIYSSALRNITYVLRLERNALPAVDLSVWC